MIETGALPAGAAVTEAALMESTGCGRTPLREAVQRLVQDRWLDLGPVRGLRVPVISVDDQLARLEVRRSLEALAVGLASTRASPEQVEELRAHAEALAAVSSTEGYVAGVARSHELIRRAAVNDYLADSLTPLQGLSRRFWLATTAQRPGEVERGRSFYVPCLRAMANRDAEAARGALLGLHDFLASSAIEHAASQVDAVRELSPPPPATWGAGSPVRG
ncbi:GntR family transcriptional regulator [Kocuria sp. p3-SID1433]|nr:GntR family transcriptional regulator [Kocuria sp. p3-SID1428]MCT2180369.1 GntR family transcriptional regulator [Kocuria sp. p3-SID1433]